MPVIGLRSSRTIDYVLIEDPAHPRHGDKAVGTPTVFVLGTVSPRIQGIVADKATRFVADPKTVQEEMSMDFAPNQANYDLVRYGLRGWKNFVDDQGLPIEYKTTKRNLGGVQLDAVVEDAMSAMKLEWITELADQLRRINEVSETEAKNSVR